MDLGQPPPKGAKEYVIRLASIYPRPKNKEIREDLRRKFDVLISLRTIRRYCEKAGVPTSSLVVNYGEAVDPHNDQLLLTARQFREQSRLSLMQLVRIDEVDFAASRLFAANSLPIPETVLGGNWALDIIRTGGSPKVSLVVENAPSFVQLKEHLGKSIIWQAFEGWKNQLVRVVAEADSLTEDLRSFPELRSLNWILPEDLATENNGILSNFLGTAIAISCGSLLPESDTGHMREGEFEETVQIKGAFERKVNVLHWMAPTGLSYALAIYKDRKSFDELKSLHINLRGELSANNKVKLLVRHLREALTYERHLGGTLERILEEEKVSGTCNACR